MRIILIALLCFVANRAVAQTESPWEPHWQARDGIIGFQRMIATPTSTVIVGDSITESFWWNLLGECRVVNYGYGGAKAEDVARHLAISLPGGAPSYAIVMIGTNDAKIPVPEGASDSYATSLQRIIDMLKAARSTVILASVPPIEQNKSLSDQRDQSFINQLNGVIAAKASAQGLKLINFNPSFMNASTGFANTDFSIDGVHPARASYATLYYKFRDALNAEVTRTGRPCG